ncbi:MAG: nitrilase-related carbon-nitrogen hydrolase, partial [Miltoncostaeaceae bacterium]
HRSARRSAAPAALSAARAWARELGVAIVAGSVLTAGGRDDRAHNTSVLIAPDGRDVALYRKVHLFDVTVDGHAFRESDFVEPGEALAVGEAGGLRIGLSVCYDLRFPELYRGLVDAGATALAVPAYFTERTGEAHWEPLLRARAIEDQCFVLAAGQCGRHGTPDAAWGHSMIVDPWGRVLAEVAAGEGFAAADLDLAEQRRIRASLPALRHRRWPV